MGNGQLPPSKKNKKRLYSKKWWLQIFLAVIKQYKPSAFYVKQMFTTTPKAEFKLCFTQFVSRIFIING